MRRRSQRTSRITNHFFKGEAMRKTIITLGAILAVAVASAASAPAAVARRSSLDSEAFWKCSTGYQFEVAGTAAHCKKAAYTARKSLAPCVIGLFAATDRVGTKDMCSASNSLTGEIGIERACNREDIEAGYTKRIVSGTDFCGKAIPETVIAPNVMITL
jgi:hypothetical protein